MEPEQNTGSFGAPIGGANALKAAMQRRGLDASILDQVSPAAPGDPSAVAPSIPGDASGIAPSVDQTLQPQPQAVSQGAPAPRSAEADIALKALAAVAKTEAKIAETVAGVR